MRRALPGAAAAFAFALLAAAHADDGAKKKPRWEPVGLSGGGALFAPAVSPLDAKLMMVNCDMSAAYVSQDGGTSWRMIHHAELRSNTRCRPAFHPTDAKVVVAANGDDGLAESHDKGEHWSRLGKLPGPPRGEVAIDPAKPDFLLCGLEDGAASSADGGATWARCAGPRGEALSFHMVPGLRPGVPGGQGAGKTCFAATRKGIWRSDDGGATWAEKTGGLPSRDIQSFSGGTNAKAKTTLLYCTVPCTVGGDGPTGAGGALAGGIFRSSNGGDSWESAMGDGLNKETKPFDQWAAAKVVQYRHVLTSDAKPATVYAWNAGTGIPPPHHTSVYRSEDAGKTWQCVFQADPRYPGLNVERDYTVATVRQFYPAVPNGVAGSATNADVAIMVDDGRAYGTVDGGKSWQVLHARPAPGASADEKPSRWLCNGLVVTSTWNYFIDPFDATRHMICYTDIGFARSQDKGKTWSWWALEGRAPWGNTCYELAFDPQVQGRVWGAFSEVHDIPNGNIIYGGHRSDRAGGVCASTDGGATWTRSNAGLPEAATVSIALDPKSPKGGRTLFAASFGHGVFRSTDDGASWTSRSDGLGTEKNKRAVRVLLHADGTLFALVTALKDGGKFLADGPGVYRSKDQGGKWENINSSHPLFWPKDFAVDPRDSKVVYVGACDANGQQQGGLWRTADGGASWTRLARQGSEHFGAYLHPKKKGWIYMTLCEGAPGAGLWLSKDDGATWAPVNGLPFSNVQRIAFDPANENVIYATTFGGSVWRGPASE